VGGGRNGKENGEGASETGEMDVFLGMEDGRMEAGQFGQMKEDALKIIHSALEKHGFDLLCEFALFDADDWEKVGVVFKPSKWLRQYPDPDALGIDILQLEKERFYLNPFFVARGYDGTEGSAMYSLESEFFLARGIVDFLSAIFDRTGSYGKTIELVSKVMGQVDFLRVRDFFSIHDITLDGLAQHREIYLVGENGEGKTLLLMALFFAYGGFHFRESNLVERTTRQLTEKALRFSCAGRDDRGNVFEIRVEKANLPIQFAKMFQGRDFMVEGKYTYFPDLYCYGANRAVYDREKPSELGFATLFDGGQALNSPLKLLTAAKAKHKRARISYEALVAFFYDLLEQRVTIIEDEDEEKFRFKEKNFAVELEQLSEGYKNVLIWTADLIFRLQGSQPEVNQLEDYQAVVMVDEIDLHLHPRWQVRFVQTLRRYFPKIQFIFTTHSPIMLQGAGDDAVFYRVYRNEEGHTEVSDPYYKKDMTHMMFNTLMTSPLFGMDSARMSPETEEVDTSFSSLRSTIDRQIRAQLDARRQAGETYISDATIEELVRKALEAELNK